MAQTFSWKLTVEGMSGEHDFKVEPIKFGDGYEQRRNKLPALKPKLQTWNARVIDRQATIRQIKDFLDARAGGESFNWKPPASNKTILVVVDKYNESPKGADIYELTFVMREVMG